MKLKIYNQSGELKLTVSTSSSSTWNNELMTENAISASFTHPFYVPLDVNDYVVLEGLRFSIKKEYKPKQKNEQTYSYSVKFYAPIHDAEQVMCLNLTDGQYNSQFSLDGSPREHMQKWVDNMNRIYGSAVWSIGDVVVADNQTIEYNNVTCWDAMMSIAEAFKTECWADGFTINLSRCEHGERVSLGYMQGLTSLTQTENSDDVKFFTRLIPLGSTKNIDRSRYGFTRLQLPDRSTYVDRNTQYGLYEYVEEAAFSEIFPHYTGTITDVRHEELTGEDEKPFTVYYFKDSGMGFDPSAYDIAGLVKHVSFQTGDLAGRDFEANYKPETQEWEIINIYPDDETQIPGGHLVPAVGNKYIPWNFRMPEEYEIQAEKDYKAAVDDYLAQYSDDVSKYGGDTDYIYIDRQSVPLLLGQRVRLLSDKYFSAGGGYRDTRMTKVVRKLDNLSIATIECTDQVGKGWKSQVDSSITQLQYVVDKQLEQTILEVLKTWDIKEPSNYNVFSALRSRAEFLSKKYPDETKYLMKFLAGLEAGEFKQGSTGVGIYQDKDGNWHIETDYLDVRMKFTAKEVEIQKVFHIGGAQVKTSAAMKCVRVEELDDVYRCYMNTTDEDGQVIYNQFKVNDQAYVQTFNLEKQADGTLGNHFFWRLVTEVGPDYIDLSKEICALASDAPKAFDDIVQLGYRGTDDSSRQVAVIDAGAGEGAPYYRQYVGINSFHLPEPETQLKPGDNKLSGVLHIEKGSTGAANLSDLPDFIQKAQQMGTVNLLRNSGFTGDYESEELSPDTELTADSELYSKALEFWTGIATVREDAAAVSCRSAVLGSLSQIVSLLNEEVYVISYKAKGDSVAVSCGDFSVAQPLTADYQRYKHSFTFSGAGVFMLSGTATVCDVQLERGTIATDWKPSPLDNDKSMAEFQSLSYIYDVLKNGSVDFIGGLILANMIQLGNYKDGKMQRVTAGISGIYNDDDDVYTWGGGTFEQAIRTVMMFKNNPSYQPTKEELASMANVVITHGGRAILNDAVFRGIVYALGGKFMGEVEQANGFNKMNEDGSVSFAGGKIRWGTDGKPVIEGKVTTSAGGKRIEISAEDNRIIMYNNEEQEVGRIDFIDSEYNGSILSLPRIRLKSVVTTGGVSSDVHSIDIQPSYISIDQVFRDGTYSVLLNTAGLEFFKDGVTTKKYSNV